MKATSHFSRALVVLIAFMALDTQAEKSTKTTTQRDIERKMFGKDGVANKCGGHYQRGLRPVRKEGHQIKVDVYLALRHIEQVNEQQQTMKLHGDISMRWQDACLGWNRRDFPDYSKSEISLETWKIWTPDLALFNSATGSKFNLNHYQYPATVMYNGRITVTSTFSFTVTCSFDFHNFPFDIQTCPIVLGDWFYTVNEVNLTSTHGMGMRLNWFGATSKTFISGWQLILPVTHRNMYWGSGGYQTEVADKIDLADTWSAMEFWITLKRHRPYFVVLDVLPLVTTSIITVVSFWIDSESVVLYMLLVNLLMQGAFSWDLLKTLPPGNNNVPKIVTAFAGNLTLTGLALLLQIVMHFIERVYPTVAMPQLIHSWFNRLSGWRAINQQGLSFAPQDLFNDMEKDLDPQTTNPPEVTADPTPEEEADNLKFTSNYIAIIRRIIFFIMVLIYLIVYCVCMM